MSLLLYPLAAMGGGLLGTLTHEFTHAVAAMALGELVDIGWQGGWAGGPYVDFRAPSRWRSEVIRKAPLALGVVCAMVLALGYTSLSLTFVAAAGGVAGLLWTSPEDLFRSRAQENA